MKQDQLILLCDQLQRDALDIYGGPVKTTAWASLADSGVVFDRCYCATPLCVPSRGSMMTGRWPHAHGATCFGGEYEILNRGEELLIDKLHDAGYHIAYDGIWHINRAAGEDRSSEYTHFVAGTFPYEYHERMRSAQRMTGGSAVQVRTPSDEGIEEWTFSVPVPSRWTRPVREHPDMKTAQRIADFILAMPDGESFAAWCSFGAPHPH